MRNLRKCCGLFFGFLCLFALLNGALVSSAYAQGATTTNQEANKGITEDVARVFPTNISGNTLVNKVLVQVRTAIETMIVGGLNYALYQYSTAPVSGNTPPPTLNTTLNMIENHYKNYCAQSNPYDSKIYGNCATTDILLQDADIKLSNILSGSFLNDKRVAAAGDYINNVVSPFPNKQFFVGWASDEKGNPKPITPDRINKETTLQDNLANALAEQALLSVARNTFAEMVAKRSAVTGSPQTLMEAYEQQACQRFYDTNWQSLMKTAYLKAMNICDISKPSCDPTKPADPSKEAKPAEAAAIDMAVMKSIELCLKFEELKHNERQEALAAAALSLQNRSFQEGKAYVAANKPAAP